jgi:hypothetical protein
MPESLLAARQVAFPISFMSVLKSADSMLRRIIMIQKNIGVARLFHE